MGRERIRLGRPGSDQNDQASLADLFGGLIYIIVRPRRQIQFASGEPLQGRPK